ncbi:hypothetical protein [Brevundimonas goettingensis]|uniref:Uncharacterized protein n=1 Tax=Brevundimonas goettingensis TaxID=2774190 RepID=A0A975C789_9CAUL|nr:hypothetical protein [Brevundimonas goettingensis]QTC92857.1 hypothetical protein IFJ75_08445 [Brevundimonas goettingensis]
MTRSDKPMATGLVVGGLGGPEDQLLEDGQEEVFAREEIEGGRVEHHTGEDDAGRTQDPRTEQGDR